VFCSAGLDRILLHEKCITNIYNAIIIFLTQQPPIVQGIFIHEVFYITYNDALQSVGLVWTGDQPDAEISDNT
jgi:hypothetical protein